MTISRFLVFSSFIVLLMGVVGCSRQAAKDQNQSPMTASPANQQQPAAEEQKEASAEASTETPSGLAELSVEDRELAKKQRICPVSGELLGAMGKPIKTTVKGKTVFLCCEGCEKQLKENPDKYLAKTQRRPKEKNNIACSHAGAWEQDIFV